ncbi:mCG145476, isoform CRA_a, partial [Mus musculus]
LTGDELTEHVNSHREGLACTAAHCGSLPLAVSVCLHTPSCVIPWPCKSWRRGWQRETLPPSPPFNFPRSRTWLSLGGDFSHLLVTWALLDSHRAINFIT